METIGDGEDETNILVVYNQREENVEVDKSEAGCVGDVDDDAQPWKEGRDGGKGRSWRSGERGGGGQWHGKRGHTIQHRVERSTKSMLNPIVSSLYLKVKRKKKNIKILTAKVLQSYEYENLYLRMYML